MQKLLMLVLCFTVDLTTADMQKVASVTLFQHKQPGNIIGTINFTQNTMNGPIRIEGRLQGLQGATTNTLGFHIHQFTVQNSDCNTAGAHYNPTGVVHGGPTDTIRHVGDLGNINRNADGTSNISFDDSVIQLVGNWSIVGRSLVVHTGTDDLGKGNQPTSNTTGNAGERYACGVIGIVTDFNVSSGNKLTSVMYMIAFSSVAMRVFYA